MKSRYRRQLLITAPLTALLLVGGGVAYAADNKAPGQTTPGQTTPGQTAAHERGRPDPNSCDPARPGLGILQVWFPRSDVNSDQRVTYREFAADAEQSFRTWDVNLDHALTGTEVDRLRTDTSALLISEGKRTNYLCIQSNPPVRATPAPNSSNPADPPAGGLPDLLAQVDTNHDGVISHTEWQSYTQIRFNDIDCNHDKLITPAEAFRFGRQEGCS